LIGPHRVEFCFHNFVKRLCRRFYYVSSERLHAGSLTASSITRFFDSPGEGLVRLLVFCKMLVLLGFSDVFGLSVSGIMEIVRFGWLAD
jgi:hypothetical protein